MNSPGADALRRDILSGVDKVELVMHRRSSAIKFILETAPKNYTA